jgi:hypothetical protein
VLLITLSVNVHMARVSRFGPYAVRALSCTSKRLHRAIRVEERQIAIRPLTQLVVYDGPIVIEEAPAVAPFRCGHRPCCTDEHAHAQLCQANADSRREKWRRKQPRAPPSPPPAPRPPGVGRGTRMPAPRQVCYLPTACSRDVCLRCLSPLRLAGALTANRYKRRSMWCCVGRPKNGQRSHTPQSQQNKIACVDPVP